MTVWRKEAWVSWKVVDLGVEEVVDLVVEGVRRWALFGLRGRPQKISAVG